MKECSEMLEMFSDSSTSAFLGVGVGSAFGGDVVVDSPPCTLVIWLRSMSISVYLGQHILQICFRIIA